MLCVSGPSSQTEAVVTCGCDLSEKPVATSLPVCARPSSERWCERYGDLRGELLCVELDKERQGLGLSLAGNRDRSRLSIFVVGLHPGGPAARDGRIRVGDELLEVRVGYPQIMVLYYCAVITTTTTLSLLYITFILLYNVFDCCHICISGILTKNNNFSVLASRLQ